MTKRIFAAALAVTSAFALVTVAGSASAHPRVPDRPNGLTVARTQQASDAPFGDCAISDVTCKPDIGGSCTHNTSQITPPATIRVYDPSYTGTDDIRVVPFETYVENVLPNEWADSWDGDALKAGAVAVTSYAWYWATHFGGYVAGDVARCFDVTHDQNFQVYGNGTAMPNSTAKVQQVFPDAIRVGGSVVQASYFSAVRSDYDVTKPTTYDTCGQGADGTFLSQSGSQTCNEDSTGNKWPVILQRYYGSSIQLASATQQRTQHDFQYLHRSTIATFAAGRWTIDDGYNGGSGTTFTFGRAGDLPTVTNDGTGFAHIGFYRPSNGTWYLGSPTGTPASYVTYGQSHDIPVQAQYDGDTSPTVLAVYRPSTGTWYVRGRASTQYGRSTDIPVPGHYYGTAATRYADGIAVYRPSTGQWYVSGHAAIQYGQKGDIPVPADYDGNGTTDIAIYRASTHTFYVRGQRIVRWGVTGDVPVTGDYTGDGKADLAVYRPSTRTWYVYGGATTTFGAAGATPVGKAPYHA